MNEKLYQETFSQIHASEDTITEVLKMAHNEKKTRKPLRTVIVLAAALTLIVTAFAAGIIRLPLGKDVDMQETTLSLSDLGQEKSHMKDAFGNALEMPEMQRKEVTEDYVAAILGDAVYSVEGNFTHDDTTYVLDTFLMDENGMGILTYTMTNPNGTGVYDAGYGAIAGGGVDIYLRNGASYDSGDICDSTTLQIGERTDTEVRVLEKFGTFTPYEGDGISIGRMETPFGHLLPEKYLTTRTGTDSDGNTVSVSPLGISIVYGEKQGEAIEGVVELRFADGTTYTVKSESVWNADLGYNMTTPEGDTISSNYMFADLVDISTLQSVHAEGSYYHDDGTVEDIVRDYMF